MVQFFQERVGRVEWIYQKCWPLALKFSGQENCSHLGKCDILHRADDLENSQQARSPIRSVFLLSSGMLQELDRISSLAFKSGPECLASL